MGLTRCSGWNLDRCPRPLPTLCIYVAPRSSMSRLSLVCLKSYPGVLLVHNSQDQIKRHAQELKKHTYTLMLTPRVTTLVTRILEEEGVLGEVTLTALNLQFIPLAEDVISLEY